MRVPQCQKCQTTPHATQSGKWQRRLDLKRFGRLIDQVRIYNPDAKDNIKEYHVVRPIPQTQFDGMPDWTTLGQNEGY